MPSTSKLEDAIMNCHNVSLDINTLFEGVCEMDLTNDQISNCLLGLHQMSEIKFKKLFNTFETVMDEIRIIQENATELRHQVRTKDTQLGEDNNKIRFLEQEVSQLKVESTVSAFDSLPDKVTAAAHKALHNPNSSKAAKTKAGSALTQPNKHHKQCQCDKCVLEY